MARRVGQEHEEEPAVLDVRSPTGRFLSGQEPDVRVQPPADSKLKAPDVCGREGCGQPAGKHPHLVMYARGYDKPHTPAQVHMALGVCDDHIAVTEPDDLITPEGWQMMTEAFVSVGRYPPDRTKVEVRWVGNDED